MTAEGQSWQGSAVDIQKMGFRKRGLDNTGRLWQDRAIVEKWDTRLHRNVVRLQGVARGAYSNYATVATMPKAYEKTSKLGFLDQPPSSQMSQVLWISHIARTPARSA
jgi:hypothetical protein